VLSESITRLEEEKGIAKEGVKRDKLLDHFTKLVKSAKEVRKEITPNINSEAEKVKSNIKKFEESLNDDRKKLKDQAF